MDYSHELLRRMKEDFIREGFVGPIPIFTSTQCDLIIKHSRYGENLEPLDWRKGRAATDRFFYNIAVRPTILLILKSLLGENIILWGASIVEQDNGQIHPWHTDIETSAANGRNVSIWVGLKNTNENSALQFVSRSHNFGKPIQQIAQERGFRRGEASSDLILGWAHEQEPLAETVQPIVRDGEAIIFDGQIWHASFNNQTESHRSVLLLQYAAADIALRMPDYRQLEWPFRFKEKPRPPTILVSGTATRCVNRQVPPPGYGNGAEKKLDTDIQRLRLPLAEDTQKRWKPYYLFHGRTRTVHAMSCHVSVLSPGHSPHAPHAHPSEELLIVLEGEAELIIPDSPDSKEPRIEYLRVGSFIYYPPYQYHTIRNSSTAPITYLMFKWKAPAVETREPLPCEIFHYRNSLEHVPSKPFLTHLLFEHPTHYLGKLQSHTTILQPGEGYAPHIDEHDVAIVMLSGKVETLGQVIANNGVVYYSAGELHGMRNIGSEPARYLVFEFHSLEKVDLIEPIAVTPPLNRLSYKILMNLRTPRQGARIIYRRTRSLLGRKKGLLGKFRKLSRGK